MTRFLRTSVGLALLACLLAGIGCGRAASGKVAASDSHSGAHRTSGRIDATALVTKAEASAIFGVPVTTIEPSGQSSVTYKTADPMFEATLEAERSHSNDDALLTMDGARKATKLLGGAPQTAAGLGDDAFYGAMSVLYVRSGDVVLTIQPPNLLQVAQGQAYNKVVSAQDPDATKKAMEELAATTKNDPLQAGSAERDPMKAATDTIAASSKPQGTEYEAKARAMAADLAHKALTRI
jgi:hypothetical protein